MPCLFLQNVPDDINWDKRVITNCLDTIKEVLGGHDLEIHILDIRYKMLSRDGLKDGSKHGIHGWIFWHEGRTLRQRRELGEALQELLDVHSVGGGFDLTFVDGEPDLSFFFNGKMVKMGE